MQTVISNKNWWHRRTTLERCLTLVSVFTCVAVLGLISGLVFVVQANQKGEELKTVTFVSSPLVQQHNITATENKPAQVDKICPESQLKDVCLSAECVHTASAIINKMNNEIEPCDDFYQFACGNYIDNNELPKDKVGMDTLSDIADKLQEQLRDIIMKERPKTEPKHFRLPNALYKACMNETSIDSLGRNPLQTISASLGGWPVVVGDSWNSNDSWTWQETVKKLRGLGFKTNSILNFEVGVDLKNGSNHIINLDQPEFGLNREYLIKGFNETLVSNYYRYMVDIAVLYGAEKKAAEKDLRKSLQFEIDLANISLPKENRRDSNHLYNLRTIKQLQASYPFVQWLDYSNALLPKGVKVDANEVINLSVPGFFEELGKLLERTDKRVIANYMLWRMLFSSMNFQSVELRQRQLQYATVLSGKQEQQARWKECVDIVSENLPIAMGALYVHKHFNQDSKAIALEMVENIRGSFSQMLDDVQWMDDKTKQEAKKKLQSMTTHIGYPDEMLDNEILEKYYDKLEIEADKYFQSLLNLNVFNTDFSLSKLRLPVNQTNWVQKARPAVVNAFYSHFENSIHFPAGILQGHLFNSQRPKYMNYGAIGYVIGHEITHGFDDQGRQFDLNGNLNNWWQPDTQKAFLEKAKCIIEQYGNYTDKRTGLNLNGINTQGENIADNGGIKESYRAYNQWVAKNGEEPRLPGLNYTPRQMFWISTAQTWCAKLRTEILKLEITTHFHSPREYRILGALRNMKDFSSDFQCPDNSPMNPLHKCEVW